jgi:hypothetical protein
MWRYYPIFLAAAILAGCQSKPVSEMSYAEVKQYGAELIARCKAEGAKPGAETQACINQEARADEAKRQNAAATRQAVGMALAGASLSYGQSLQANRPATCYTSGYGYGITTTCY